MIQDHLDHDASRNLLILNNFVKFVLNSSEQFVVHNNTCDNVNSRATSKIY